MIKKRVFIFLVNTIFFTFQAEGMFLEQTASRATRCLAKENVLNRGFKSVREKTYVLSEELPLYRANSTYSSSHTRPFQFLSRNYYQYTQRRKPFNWLLLAAGGGALAAMWHKFFEQPKEYPQDLKEDKLPEKLLIGYKKVQAIKEQKGVIFVLGNTGAGKSTFIARLMGAKISEYKDKYGKQTIKITKNPKRFPKIGYDLYESETFYPELWFAEDLAICDCPGFKDSRGGNYQFVENICLEYAVRSAKSKKFVMIVAEDTMTVDRGGNFRDLIRDLSNLLTNKENFNGAPGKKTTLDSLVWAITKVPVDRTLQEIRNRIEALERDIGEKKEKERALLNSIGRENTFLLGPFDRKRVFSHIRELEATSETQFSVVDPDQKQKFVNLSINVFQEAFSLDEELKIILGGIEELNKVVQFRNWLQNIHLASPDTIRERLLGIMGKKIEEINMWRNIKKKEKNEILDELRKLEQDKKETLIWDYTKSEERSWGSLNWSVFDFKYNEGKPFTRVEVEKDEYSSEYDRKEDGEKGVFEAQYKGGMGRQCRVTVRLFKEDPVFSALKKLSTDRLQEERKAIKEIDAALFFLGKCIIKIERGNFEETIQFLSEIMSSDSEQELKKLIKKSEEKRAELRKKKEIGHALLEIGYDYLRGVHLTQEFEVFLQNSK